MKLTNSELTSLYTAAWLISGSVDAAQEAVVSAYEAFESRCGDVQHGRRMDLLMREVIAASKRLADGGFRSGNSNGSNGQSERWKEIEHRLLDLDVNERAAVVVRDVLQFSREDAAKLVGATSEQFRQLLSDGRQALMVSAA